LGRFCFLDCKQPSLIAALALTLSSVSEVSTALQLRAVKVKEASW